MSGERSRFFSESWHRVAGFTLFLKPEVEVHLQTYRGERWYVLHDPFNNRFYRLRSGAYRFVSRLREGVTVEEVWRGCLEEEPDEAPGQEEVLQLLGHLFQANLVSSNLPPDSAKMFDRLKKQKARELRGKLASFMTPRFPLFDPDGLLRRCVPVGRVIFGWPGLAGWLLVVGWAGKVGVERSEELLSGAQGVLSSDNLVWLYLVSALIKAVHEFGHGLACRTLGGQVHTVGVLLMFLVPLPYVDATSSYAFRKRRDRILVASAGILFELFIAAAALLVWASVGDGPVRSLAFNVVVVASVTTLLFNANPLLKFDGYYILSDLLDVPNLYQRSLKQLQYWVERYAFGLPNLTGPALTVGEAWILSGYGVACFGYRIFLIFVLLQLVADMFMGLGMILAGVLIFLWVLAPLAKGLAYLWESPKLLHHRGRAWGVTGAVAAVLVLLTGVVPFPRGMKAPGVLRAEVRSVVYAETDGTVVEILARPGQRVGRGDAIVRLVNTELEEQHTAAVAELQQTELERARAEREDYPALPGLLLRRRAAEASLEKWRLEAEKLVVRAPEDGLWLPREPDHLAGMLLVRGTDLGEIVRADGFSFVGVVDQEEADYLFGGRVRGAEVRLRGASGRGLRVKDLQFIPAEHRKLPSAGLGWGAKGDVPVDPTDPEGMRAERPFYLVRALMAEGIDVRGPAHNRRGYIRLELPPEPLLLQWGRWLGQLLQEKYRV